MFLLTYRLSYIVKEARGAELDDGYRKDAAKTW